MSDTNFFDMVENELSFAKSNYPKFNSEHEGFAVLKEEVDELWEAVRLKQSDPKRAAQIRREAVQVAAMAFRFLYDLCEPKYGAQEFIARQMEGDTIELDGERVCAQCEEPITRVREHDDGDLER